MLFTALLCKMAFVEEASSTFLSISWNSERSFWCWSSAERSWYPFWAADPREKRKTALESARKRKSVISSALKIFLTSKESGVRRRKNEERGCLRETGKRIAPRLGGGF